MNLQSQVPQVSVGRRDHADPDTGWLALWQLFLRRAKLRGFKFWYLFLTACVAVGMGYIGTRPYSAASFVIMMNVGWGSTALTFWAEIKARHAQYDYLLLPISNREWQRIMDRFFLMGFVVAFGQYLVFFSSLYVFHPDDVHRFLWSNLAGRVHFLRILFHSLVLLNIIGFFWTAYWASYWRGWALAVFATLPVLVLGAGFISVMGLVDTRLLLSGTGIFMLVLGFVIRSWVGRHWLHRAAALLT